MAMHFNALAGVLFNPAETFKRLKKDAELVDGLKLYLIAGVVVLIVEYLVAKMMLAGAMVRAMTDSGWLSIVPLIYGNDLFLILSLFASMVIGLAFFFLLAWLTAKFAKSMAEGKCDFGKTFALLSYTGAAFVLFLNIPLDLITGALIGASPNIAVMGLVSIVMLIAAGVIGVWELLVAGRATAEANGIGWGEGIVTVLIATFIVVLAISITSMLKIGMMLSQSAVRF